MYWKRANWCLLKRTTWLLTKFTLNTVVRYSGSTNLIASISFKFFVIGVLNKDGDVADMRSYSGVVVNHGDGCLFCPHLQERLEEEKRQKKSQINSPPLLPRRNDLILSTQVPRNLDKLSTHFHWIMQSHFRYPDQCFPYKCTGGLLGQQEPPPGQKIHIF